MISLSVSEVVEEERKEGYMITVLTTDVVLLSVGQRY
jgi:hypothetical protein